jgi:hypothetical protein
MKKGRADGFVCLLCEKWYAEMEDAEVCERRHEQNPREKYDDDGAVYADPRDFRDGLE